MEFYCSIVGFSVLIYGRGKSGWPEVAGSHYCKSSPGVIRVELAKISKQVFTR
jgi:hypothetical protein